MTQEASHANLTLALNTTLEREFVSPLTSIRGALEILRDFPDLPDKQRQHFLANALEVCTRLELGIEQSVFSRIRKSSRSISATWNSAARNW